MEFYKFASPLKEALIKSRPNRFIMIILVAGKECKAHCPATGRIGNIKFKDIPCLVSEAENPERKTRFTVEAISLDLPNKKDKSWIGINQTKVNHYIEFFLNNNSLTRMIKGEVKREVKLGNSRIDFQIGKNYLEIKMPLIFIDTPDNIETNEHSKFNSFDRLIKHFDDLGKSLKTHEKAIIALAYMFDAKPFHPPEADDSNSKIINAARRASNRGVENWQINLKINPTGVYIRDYFRLNMFK
jgi:sugar fermentation stimulation protein A